MTRENVKLYIVTERTGPTAAVLVAATSAEEALKIIIEAGLDEDVWTLANTHTRRILRGLDEEPQFVAVLDTKENAKSLRITGRSRKSAERRRQRGQDHEGPARNLNPTSEGGNS